MLDNITNSNTGEEVVHPPQDSNSVEVVQPQNELTPDTINNMTSDEFKSYLSELGNKPDEAEGRATENNTTSEPKVEAEDNSAEEAKPEIPEQQEEMRKETPPAETTDLPYRIFNTEAELDEEVNSRFRARMKKHNDSIEKYSTLEEMAKVYYPDAEDPISAMTKDLEEQAAEKMNVSADEIRTRTKDKLDAEKYRQQVKENEERNSRTEEIIKGWERDADQLKLINPQFDLKESIKNPEFKKILAGGGTVAQAYSQVYKSAPPKAAERPPIQQNAQTATVKGSGVSQADPSKLPTKAFMKYINNIKNS